MEALRAISLPPGFGFHPTDVELISHYLKRKHFGPKIDSEVIPELDIYKYEPWDLPAKCQIPTSESKWHFFTSLDRKYPNGSRSSRTTKAGYWKSTGKDRSIRLHNKVIGTKKTLVFHHGRPPRGKRTVWIMHEYYVDENEFKAAPSVKDFFVLCRVTKRDGLEIDGENVSSKTKEVDTFPKPPVNVAVSLVKEEPSNPSENTDIEQLFNELFLPNFCAIPTISELEIPIKEDSTLEQRQESVNFLPNDSEGFHLLQPGDDMYSFLQPDDAHGFNSDMFEDFNSKITDDACIPQLNDGLLDDLSSLYTSGGYIGNYESGYKDMSVLCVPASIVANDEDNAVIERRERHAKSTGISNYRIKLKVHKVEAKNGGATNQTLQSVNQNHHVDVNADIQYPAKIEVKENHSAGQSSDSVGALSGSLRQSTSKSSETVLSRAPTYRKRNPGAPPTARSSGSHPGNTSCTLGITRHLLFFLHQCISHGLHSFLMGAFTMGIVAVVLYFLLNNALGLLNSLAALML